jgi:hypothetical protein
MRSVKDYTKTSPARERIRPAPSVEGNEFRGSLAPFIIVFLLLFGVYIFT